MGQEDSPIVSIILLLTLSFLFSVSLSLARSDELLLQYFRTLSCLEFRMRRRKFYLTSAIPYVNARPHLGHAQEYVIADCIQRYHELLGDGVFLGSGADENALKNVQAAEKEELSPSVFLKKYSDIFRDFYGLLGVSLDVFRRGTDQTFHWPGVQLLWNRCLRSGDIYKKRYVGLYCVGGESFKRKKDLLDGKCPDHNTFPERIEEENYFFRLSKYQHQIEDLITSDTLRIFPQKRRREILSFVRMGLEDFSISRSNERARGVGVPIPGDDGQKIYVWFDALAIYMTGVGYGYDERLWKAWWPADLHIIGKDIIRFHAVYWPAILLSAKLPLPKALLVHGFITIGGHKMSKTIGNVIDPYWLLNTYGLDAVRYFLLREIPTLDDGDFTLRRFEELYTSDLSNGLGNLVSRIATLAQRSGFSFPASPPLHFRLQVKKHLEDYRLDLALSEIWKSVSTLNHTIDRNRPWTLSGMSLRKVLTALIGSLRQVGFELQPFLPDTSAKILARFAGPKILAQNPFFPHL